MAEERDIKYINREFGDFREQLIELAKNYFPDTYNDFSPTSPGMMFIEMASYVGDVLSFYQDNQLQETYLQHAKNPANLYALAYMMGYRPRATAPAEAELTVTQRVEAVAPDYTPNWDQALKISQNASISSDSAGNVNFLTDKEVDFNFSSSVDPTDITVYSVDAGNPAEYLLSKKVKATAGKINSTSFTVGTSEKFKTFTIDDENIIGILDIVDSDGNSWTEVPFLAQDTIFKREVNTSSDNALAPNNLTLERVPRRFVTRLTSKNVLQIQFGAGVSSQEDSEFLPNPENFDYTSRELADQLDTAYDPSNFIFSRTYGLAPSNTTLTVRYLTGGGVESNVPANSLVTQDEVTITATDSTYQGTLAFFNEKPAAGGKDGDSVDELRENSLKAFSEQKRTVTARDYAVRALSMPSDFGVVSKAFVTQGIVNSHPLRGAEPLALNLYVLSYDYDKKLTQAGTSLKNNLKKYLAQYKLVTDTVNIHDAFVVNIGVRYEVVVLPNYNGKDVLAACTEKLKEYFKVDKWSINQPINLASIYTLLDRVKGVQTVKNVEVFNKAGGNYATNEYDVKGATKDNVVYPSYDPSIFEVKFPDTDIEGRITSL